MSAIEIAVGENKAWKTVLIYRSESGLALERYDLKRGTTEEMPISLAELAGLGRAVPEMVSKLESADVANANGSTGSLPDYRASSARDNSPSSPERGNHR